MPTGTDAWPLQSRRLESSEPELQAWTTLLSRFLPLQVSAAIMSEAGIVPRGEKRDHL